MEIKSEPPVSSQDAPALAAHRHKVRRKLKGAFVICLLALPIGFAVGNGVTVVCCIFGLIVIPIKLSRMPP